MAGLYGSERAYTHSDWLSYRSVHEDPKVSRYFSGLKFWVFGFPGNEDEVQLGISDDRPGASKYPPGSSSLNSISPFRFQLHLVS